MIRGRAALYQAHAARTLRTAGKGENSWTSNETAPGRPPRDPQNWFTGAVRIDPLFQPPDPARVAGACVTFEPGARTAWHTHPLGQTLIVTFGVGRVQRWGGPIEEIRPGDVVWFSPGEKHCMAHRRRRR